MPATRTLLPLPGAALAPHRIGQALIGLLFLVSGLLKLGRFEALAGVLAGKGLPLAAAVMALAIALEVAAGAALVLNLKPRIAAAALALFVMAATLLFHSFWAADAAAYANQLNHFLKNLAILGALLSLARPPTRA
ncbi:MAG TPA: DoxX family protein [Ramlibacter sp.]|nr:DoxX family protein [Ramlibacter sp.]